MRTTNLELESRLAALIISINENDSPELWREVEQISQTLANSLRVKGGEVDSHTALGRSQLPRSLTSLITLGLHGSPTPADEYTGPIFEVLRVAANLCLDHDDNRGHLLDAELPQTVVSLLEGYAERVTITSTTTPFSLSIPHLKVVRTAIGVLLNASIGYDAVKFRLISLEAVLTILKLSSTIYPPTSWASLPNHDDGVESATLKESWLLRSGISNWAWRTVSEIKDVKEDTLQILNPDVLPWIIPTLSRFIPYSKAEASDIFASDPTLFSALVQADFEVLEETCTLLESLSLDVEDIRLALARGYCFPAEHYGVPCFSMMLDFIEHGTYHPTWTHSIFSSSERKRREKTFDICKAALVKSVVEVAGEGRNEDILWDDSKEEKPGGEFVCRMVEWIKSYVAEVNRDPAASHRDDLVICASLSLGNLARREKTSTALLSPPLSLASTLSSPHFLSPAADVKLKHGILGLLKHLAQSSTLSPIIPESLGQAHIVERINESGIWDEKADAMANIVQLNAISVVKHLSNASVDHSLALVLPPLDHPASPAIGLSQILALVARSEYVPIKSEGTRVLVNVIKSLWANKRSTSILVESPETLKLKDVKSTEKQFNDRREAAIATVLTHECALTLSWFTARSGKFPILVNEGIVALNLVCTRKEGGELVLDVLATPLPESSEPVETPPSALDSEASSPTLVENASRSALPSPRHALDMLIAVLRNVDNPVNYQVEIRVNVCTFLIQLSRHTSGSKLSEIKEAVWPVLEKVKDDSSSKEEMLVKAASRVLDFWK